jgi:hypothetical protein
VAERRSTLDFRTVDGDRAWASVEGVTDGVRLVVSIQRDGDYDLVLDEATALELAQALVAATSKGAA